MNQDAFLNNEEYLEMLSIVGSLSKLFSDSTIPYINYRATENIFCKYFEADNLSRDDTAYDARVKDFGVGIKTFQFETGSSFEKVAEFNRLSPSLRPLRGIELARKVSEYRNARILSGNGTYGVNTPLYHIIGRIEKALQVFNHPYVTIDVDNITGIKDDDKSLKFNDGQYEYSFNKSKSVLQMKFRLPSLYKEVPITIIDDPYELLKRLFDGLSIKSSPSRRRKVVARSYPYVLLPLFSTRKKDEKTVPESSGINQWNAKGRPRHYNEVYIPIPKKIHSDYPDFFPDRDTPFKLHLPNGKTIEAKVCQDGGKALMSNPNKDLGEWLLRDVLHQEPEQLVTMETLNVAGFDTVILYRRDKSNYYLDVCYSDNYEM